MGWKRGIKSSGGRALCGGNVDVSDADCVVWACDAEAGAAVWKNVSLKYRHLSPPAFFGGYAVVADFDGYVHFLNPSDGSFAGRIRAGSDPVSAAMVATEDRLYIQNVEGRITALSLRKN